MTGRARRTLLALISAGLLAITVAGAPAAIGQDGGGYSSDEVTHVFHDGGATGGHVTVDGDRLYAGAYGLGFRIFDISEPQAPVEIGSYLPGGRADAVPDAAEWDGRHIATLNGTRRVTRPEQVRTDRTEFLDVTDPANPELLWEFVGQEDGEAHNGDIVDERRLWLPSGGSGENGLRIYDMNPLLEDEPQAPQSLFRADPVALWESSPYREGKDVGPEFTHTHDKSVSLDYPVRQPDGSLAPRDIVLLAEGGSYADDGPDYGAEHGNTGSVFVVDITDPADPVVLTRWLHANQPGHHPIRYTHEVQFLDGDPRLMLVTDEDMHHPCGPGGDGAVDTAGGGVTGVRLSETLTEAVEESEWFIPEGTPAAPVCSVHVMDSQDGYAFFGSYNAGLQIVDYRDPANPVQAGFGIQPGTMAWGAYAHDDGVVYVGDMTRGLDVFTFEPAGESDLPGGARVSGEMTGSQEVAPVLGTPGAGDPRASGFATATFRPGAGAVCYEVSHDLVPEPHGFHIHEGAPGENGDIVVDFFTDPTGTVPPTGCVDVDRDVAKRILRNPDGYYFNLHNAAFPNGAIRGQLSKG